MAGVIVTASVSGVGNYLVHHPDESATGIIVAGSLIAAAAIMYIITPTKPINRDKNNYSEE